MAVIDRATLDLINLIRSQQGANARQSNQMRGNEIIGQGILRGTENAVAGVERGRDRRQHQADRASDVQFRQQQLDERRRSTDLKYGQSTADQSIFMQLANQQAGQPINLTSAPKGDESDFFAPPYQPGDIQVTGRESPAAMRYATTEADKHAKENTKLQRAEKQRQALLANAKSPEDISIVNSAGPDELDNLLTASYAHNYKSQHDTQQAQAGAEQTHSLIDAGAWGIDPAIKHILHGRTDAWAAGGGGDVRMLHGSFDSVIRPRAGQMTDSQKAVRAQEIQSAYDGLVDPKYMPALVDAATHGQSTAAMGVKFISESSGDPRKTLSILRERRANAQARLNAAIYDEDPNVRKAATDDLQAITDAHDAMMQKMLGDTGAVKKPAKERLSQAELDAIIEGMSPEELKSFLGEK